MRHIPFLSLFMFLLVSCNTENNKNTEKIDRLFVRLDSVENNFKLLHIDGFQQKKAIMDSTISFVNANSGTVLDIDPGFVEYFGRYSGAAKILGRIFKKHIYAIEKELEFSSSQLESLKHDINSNIINNADSINIYIDAERDAIGNLDGKIDKLRNMLLQQESAYSSAHGKVDSVIEIAKQRLSTVE